MDQIWVDLRGNIKNKSYLQTPTGTTVITQGGVIYEYTVMINIQLLYNNNGAVVTQPFTLYQKSGGPSNILGFRGELLGTLNNGTAVSVTVVDHRYVLTNTTAPS